MADVLSYLLAKLASEASQKKVKTGKNDESMSVDDVLSYFDKSTKKQDPKEILREQLSEKKKPNTGFFKQFGQSLVGYDDPNEIKGWTGAAGESLGDLFRNRLGLSTTDSRMPSTNEKLAMEAMEAFKNFSGGMAPKTNPMNPSVGRPNPYNITPTQYTPLQGSLQSKFAGQDPVNVIGQSLDKRRAEKAIDMDMKDVQEARDAQKSTKGSSLFMRRFAESHNEINKAFPGAGDASLEGKMKRWAAGISAEHIGNMPKTEAFLRRMKPIANAQARMVEGGRVTDQDRQVYADAMVNAVSAPDETNSILAADAILDFHNKGANVKPLLEDLTSQDIAITQSIVKEVLRMLPAEERERLLK